MFRTRITNNIDTKTFEPVYGVQVNQGNGWHHVAKDGEMFLTKDKKAAEEMRKDLKARALKEAYSGN